MSNVLGSESLWTTGQRVDTAFHSPVRQELPRRFLMKSVGLQKSYRRGKRAIPVLKGVDLEIEAGKFTAIVGKSGSGKSTLLHLLGTLDAPDSGEIFFEGERIDRWSARRKDQFRNHQVGMIFQFYHLLPELTALENVLVPRMIQHGLFGYWRNRGRYRREAADLLDLVGLSHRIRHRPNQLSGGEMQRTAIARALISEPTLLLADEPTGNLDSESGGEVIDTLLALRRQRQITIVMVTHDENIAASADRVVAMVDGVVQVRR
jgi:lipoprotein-releasing system ATP-binding protein